MIGTNACKNTTQDKESEYGIEKRNSGARRNTATSKHRARRTWTFATIYVSAPPCFDANYPVDKSALAYQPTWY